MLETGSRAVRPAARPFYELVRGDLETFAKKHGLLFTSWHQDEARFFLEEPKDREPGYEGMVRAIQLYIEPRDDKNALMSIFSVVLCDKGGRRTKTVFVAMGQLSRDQSRLESWLECALAICRATLDSDLLGIDEWQKIHPRPKPLFS